MLWQVAHGQKLMVNNIAFNVVIYFFIPTLLLLSYRYGLFHAGLLKDFNLKRNLNIIITANLLNFTLLFLIYAVYIVCQFFGIYFLMAVIFISGYFLELIGMSFEPQNTIGNIIKMYSLLYLFIIMPIIYFVLAPFIFWKFVK